jgi:DNA-binding transcriptional MerR regulator
VSVLDISKEEYISSLIDDLKNVKYIMPDNIPNIDLYMDQVTTFMDKHLKSSKRYSEDKLLTKTMINNYTKNELLPPPDRKKYTKEHMFLLIFIYYFKNIMSISDIQSIFNPLTERYYGGKSDIGLEEIYEEIFRLENEQTEALTKDMIRKMTKAKGSFESVENKDDRDFLTMFSFICMLSFDVYMRKHVIEQIIDNSLKTDKEQSKKAPSANGKDAKDNPKKVVNAENSKKNKNNDQKNNSKE